MIRLRLSKSKIQQMVQSYTIGVDMQTAYTDGELRDIAEDLSNLSKEFQILAAAKKSNAKS